MTHDGATHLLRIGRLDEHIRDGILFSRWFPDLILGHGYPVLNYYAAGTYYLVEALHLLGLNLYYAFIVAQVVMVYLAAVGMYLFARDLFGDRGTLPALVTSIAYVYAPYLMINIYVRGAIAELGAQMLLPWILWSFRRLWLDPNPRRYLLVAIFALGGLAWTHTISLLIIPPLLVAYMVLLLSVSNDHKSRVRWSAVAIVGAMGISSFYWLPLIIERHYISDVGFAISKTLMLPKSFIDWRNFLDTGWRYTFPEDPPFRFGLVQVLGVVTGSLFLWRKSRELWFWFGVLLFCLLMMSEITKPLWFSNEILPIIQFPWRLQALLGFPVALLFGLPFLTLRTDALRVTSAALIAVLMVGVYFPYLPWAYILAPESNFGMALNAYFETDRTYIIDSGEMTTTVQEFRPKWATQTLTLDPESVIESPVGVVGSTPTRGATVQLLAASPFQLHLRVKSDMTFPLRFATYFFPGWSANLDGTLELVTYPSTNLGLLTVDLPAGEHNLIIAWQGTWIAAVAGFISQVTLLGIALWQLSQRTSIRWWGIVPLCLLGLGISATYVQPPASMVQQHSTVELPGLHLMGHLPPKKTNDGILMQLYWLATETKPEPLAIRWQVRSEDETVVAETVSAPFYDAYTTEQWASNTVVDDSYLIPFPQSLVAGRYSVVMMLLNPQGDWVGPELTVGAVDLPNRQAMVLPQQMTEANFANAITLNGYDFHVAERLWPQKYSLPARPDIPVVNAGNTIKYMLYWHTQQETNEPYVSFMHLTDRLGQPLAQSDHLPGPLFIPPATWTTYNQYRDQFLLGIPWEATSGLYWPNVGMYNWKDRKRIDVMQRGEGGVGDHFKLPPVKIINRSLKSHGTSSKVQFDTMAELISFEVEGGQAGKRGDEITGKPGATLTLTLYYRVHEPSDQELRRFVQIRNADEQMLAQFDSEPQNGINPTWAWVPQEIVKDTVVVEIPQDAITDSYVAYIGYYRLTAAFERLALFDRDGNDLPNREYPLFTLKITP